MGTHYKQARTAPGVSINWLDSLRLRGVTALSAGLDFDESAGYSRGDDMDPNPDYDASDEVEYGANWFGWILRGVYPPPAYPPV
jgi:hypothetical protein